MNKFYSSQRVKKFCVVCGEYLFNKPKTAKYCKTCAVKRYVQGMKDYNEKRRIERMQLLQQKTRE